MLFSSFSFMTTISQIMIHSDILVHGAKLDHTVHVRLTVRVLRPTLQLHVNTMMSSFGKQLKTILFHDCAAA